MKEYLAFVDEIGRTIDGKYIYRFDFTIDTDTVWGEYFNIAPSALVPNLQVDKNSLYSTAKVIFPREMAIAKKSFCFSMQDCIDGIMPLFFSEIDENTLEYDGKPFFFNFGQEIETVEAMLSAIDTQMFDIEIVEKGDDSAMDNLIDSLNSNNDYEDDDDLGGF